MQPHEIIASRTFKGFRQGVEFELKISIGKPQRPVAPDMRRHQDTHFSCPYEIDGGDLDLPVKRAAGVDALQALQLALRMLEADLVALKEDCGGQLWWGLAPRMGLGLAWAEE